MIPGLYQSASGMLTQMENHQVIAENLAASAVPGFRRSNASFETYLDPALQKGGDPAQSDFTPGKSIWPASVPTMRVTTDFTPGGTQIDGNSSHLALSGAGFFAVQLPQDRGVGFTRTGLFHISPQGQLVSAEDYPVLNENGTPITLTDTATPFKVSESGEIQQKGETIDKLQISNLKDPTNELKWVGGTYFQAKNDKPEILAVTNSKVMQGYLENSNVNQIQEMISMMQAMRSYEANQKMLQGQDSTLEQVIRQVPNH